MRPDSNIILNALITDCADLFFNGHAYAYLENTSIQDNINL